MCVSVSVCVCVCLCMTYTCIIIIHVHTYVIQYTYMHVSISQHVIQHQYTTHLVGCQVSSVATKTLCECPHHHVHVSRITATVLYHSSPSGAHCTNAMCLIKIQVSLNKVTNGMIHTNTHPCMHVQTYIHRHTYTHTCTHTHRHTHTLYFFLSAITAGRFTTDPSML